jgi:ElaB/YqjD/DUF883 family membrane-anchored ribosome-binding protein
MTKSNVVNLPKRGEAAAKTVSDFVREHPGAVVAGGAVLGLIAGTVLARGTGRKLARHALTIAEVAGTASLALGRQAAERAEDAGDVIADTAGKLAEPAEEAVDAASEAAQRLLRKAIDLAGRLRG